MPRKSAKEEPEIIAQRLGRLLRGKGLTHAEMAELLGLFRPIISDYEQGGLRLHGELMVRLAEIPDCSADELLGLRERKV